jgi:monoamine oxidase
MDGAVRAGERAALEARRLVDTSARDTDMTGDGE